MANFYYNQSDSNWYSDAEYTTSADISTITAGDFVYGNLYGVDSNGTGYAPDLSTYFINRQWTTLDSSGTGWDSNSNVYYINAVATTLDSSGTGWDSNSNVYYINAVATTLDQAGSGFWSDKAYYYGSEQPTGWNDYFWYIDNVETTLDLNGTGIWNNRPYANGSGTNLDGINFWGQTLTGVDFSNVTSMVGTNFDSTNLTSPDFSNVVNMESVSFWRENLAGVNFSSVTSIINGAIFFDTNLTGANFSNLTVINNAQFINLDLTGADFSNVTNLDGSQFSNANLAGVVFGNTISGYIGNVYFISGQATGTDSNGSGFWSDKAYYYGSEQPTGWNDYFWYIDNVETTLDNEGNGEWNGQTYVNGVVQGGGGGSVNLASGLQAFYKLSDTSDSSGNNRTLTNNGNVSFASGKIGNAAVFDGSNYLTIPSSPALVLADKSWNISLWVNFSTVDGEFQNIIESFTPPAGPGWTLYLINGNIEFYTGSEPITTVSVQANQWYNIVVNRNNQEDLKIFINGNLEYTGSHNVTSFEGDWVIGSRGTDSSFLNGSIDAVGIWNRALSDAEVAALYNSGNGLELEVTLETGLQAFYKLSDTSDSSGNNRTLTNNGNVSFASGKLGNAASFDGSGNYLYANAVGILENEPLTISAWVKHSDQPQPSPLLYTGQPGGNNGFGIYAGSDANGSGIGVLLAGNQINVSEPISSDVWTHIVIVTNPALQQYKVYFNGSVSGSGSSFNSNGSDGLFIGTSQENQPATGSVDAVGIWNRALSDSEISALYNNGTGLEIQATLETGLQAFYKLSDTSDSSGNNRTLTNNGNVSFASGKIGNAAVFDGSNYLSREILVNEDELTVSCLAYFNDIEELRTVWAKGADAADLDIVYYEGQLNYFVSTSDGGGRISTGFTPQLNQWYHFALTHSSTGGIAKFYVDGQMIGSTNISGNRISNSVPFAIGASINWQRGFNGQIDAVGIWNRALSDAEVAELYNNGTGLELPAGPTVKNGWINNIYWINDVATTLDQNGDGTWVGKLYENGSLFSGSKYSLTFVDGVAQAEQIVTVIGSNIPVAFGLNEAEEPLVELVFASITSAGETTIEQIIPTVLPTGYTVAETVLAYSIDTTATFEGSINVDFILPSNTSQAVFDRVKGFHVKNSGAIEEMTRVSSDFSTKRITVAITSFSDFLFLDTPQTGKTAKVVGKAKFVGKIKFA
jgi:uncharacterized protein YjbI with pentapeptide repeats